LFVGSDGQCVSSPLGVEGEVGSLVVRVRE
jgi:hypothetical protein